MLDRDSQTLAISRQALLLVTAMGVGLLTLVYVLGVQVGKQSASLRRSASKASGEELMELPAPLAEQLRPFEASQPADKPAPKVEAPPAQAAPADPPQPEPKKAEPKPEPSAGVWTLQLVSTPDAAEAARVVAKAKAAGFTAVILKEKKVLKVRLAKPMSREGAEAAVKTLKPKGIKAFPVKVN